MYRLELVRIDQLRAHEETIEERLRRLKAEILADGVVKVPILVDTKTMVILDGHHRVRALKELGMRLVPAALVDYDSDCIKVLSWREDYCVSKELVRVCGLVGRLLPPRTSRHVTCFEIPRVDVPLKALRGEPVAGALREAEA